MVQRCCPACGSDSANPLRKIELTVPDDFGLQDKFWINACKQCGMVFHNISVQDDREQYYESYTGTETIDYAVSEEQKRFNELTMNFLMHAGLSDTNTQILDVGCSFGLTLMSLKKAGFGNLYAIDPDRSAIRYLERNGIPGQTGSASDNFPELNGRFDLIILRHVIEHLYSPLSVIENVRSWLKPGGKIYIEVPDLTRYKECAPFPGYFFEYEHINHFSLLSLLNLMRRFSLTHYESTPEIYPCIRALFEQGADSKPLHSATADANIAIDSLTKTNAFGQIVLRRIAALEGQEIALWGVSTLAYRMLTHTPLGNCKIKHLVDSSRKLQGKKVGGITIASPQSLVGFNGSIVLCGENSADSIERAARAMGLGNPVIRLLQPVS